MLKMTKWILLSSLLVAPAAQAQVTAQSCSSTDVQAAINSASAGQTVSVPAGNCTWGSNSVAINKAITLNGAGQGVTNILVNSNPSVNITKQTGGPTRIKNLSFTGTSANVVPHFIAVGGPWPNGQPVIFQNVTFNANGGTMVDVGTPGGAIFSHIAFVGTWDNALVTIKDPGETTSWHTPDTLGSKDTTGFANVYIEDSTFIGGSNGVTDCDDSCRMVVRHNTFGFGGRDSGGPNSHGQDSSPQGMRHFEIYSNSFLFPDKTCTAGNSSLSNTNQFIWIRGGTGVIYNNNFDHLSSTCWGTKTEIKLSNRGAEDDRPQGTCSATHYPVPHQIGQNNNGSSDFTDPIWFWGNNGATISVSGSWGWGNPCGFDWNTFFQWGRDGSNSSLNLSLLSLSVNGVSVSGLGGSPKPGYTAYTYPHPLAQGSASASAPAAPSNLSAIIQ